jgi:sec-independent protein translocase protein TatB
VFNIDGLEWVVLALAAIFILGPERLPGAARWLGQSVRKVREFASNAREQLDSELAGSEFDELRKPLEDLRSLRDMNPRRMITQHLLDGYDPAEDLRGFDVREEIRGMDPREEMPGFDLQEEIRKATGGGTQNAEPAQASVRPNLSKDGQDHANPQEGNDHQGGALSLRKDVGSTTDLDTKPNGYPLNAPVSAQRALASGEWPPVDPDAT